MSIIVPVRAAGISQTAVVVDTCPHCCCRYLPTLLLLPALAHTAVACTFPTLLLPAFALIDVAGTCPHCCCRHLPTLLLPALAHTAVVAGTYPHCCCCRHLPTLMLPEFQLLSSLGPSVSKHFVLNRGTHGIRSGFVGSLQNREVCEI